MTVDLKKEGHIAIITINRPEAANALDIFHSKELSRVLIEFREDPELWVGIITGAGEKAFCAGADIKDTLPFMQAHAHDAWNFPDILMRGLELWKPLIAAINGLALGGGLEVALACDLRVAAENARLGTPEVGVGLIPGWGGTQRLPRAVSACKAAELLLVGKPVDAQEALRIGLVNKVVPKEQLMAAAMEYAAAICNNAPLAVRAAKQAMLRGKEMSMEEGLKLESELNAYIFSTADFNEGIKAFSEKRKPSYKAQ